MKKSLLSLLLLSIAITGFSKTWTIINVEFTFSPSEISILLDDSVFFDLESMHNAVEVSQLTWEANGNTPLPGGFSVPFGGGLVLPEKLTTGTHYYVCTPHAFGGMKGIIIVQSAVGIPVNPLTAKISIYPNPSNGKFQLDIIDSQFANEYSLEIYDAKGGKIFATSQTSQQTNFNLDLSGFPKGIYFIRLFDGNLQYKRKIIIQ